MPNTSPNLSTKEAAEVLEIAPRTLRQWIKDGHIKAIKSNPQSKSVYQIPAAEVERILAERKKTQG